MRGIFGQLLAAALVGSLASCGSDDGSTDQVTPPTAPRVKSGEMFDDDSQAILKKYGSVNPALAGGQGGGASESQKSNQQFEGDFAKRDFKSKNYDRKAFWGSKDYEGKVYNGNQDGSRFVQDAREGTKASREGGLAARESNSNHDRGRSFGGDARESSAERMSRPSDAETDVRRRVFVQPKVEDVQHKRALTVEDTRGMLGR